MSEIVPRAHADRVGLPRWLFWSLVGAVSITTGVAAQAAFASRVDHDTTHGEHVRVLSRALFHQLRARLPGFARPGRDSDQAGSGQNSASSTAGRASGGGPSTQGRQVTAFAAVSHCARSPAGSCAAQMEQEPSRRSAITFTESCASSLDRSEVMTLPLDRPDGVIEIHLGHSTLRRDVLQELRRARRVDRPQECVV